jgi:DNA-binding MarR family transcriptional regulator
MSDQDISVLPPTSPSSSERSFSKRWKHEGLLVDGYLVVPSQFMRLYARLKPYPLTVGEAMFVLHLMEFKWSEAAPYPSYRILAERMGCSDKLVRRHARSLEEKKLLRRKQRRATTNLFDLTPLFDALLNAIERDRAEMEAA